MGALAAFGCANPVGPDARFQHKGVSIVEVKGAVIGYSFGITPAPVECTAPLTRRTGIQMAGEVSNMGWTVVAMEHCNSASDAIGTGTLTAATGEQVRLAYTQDASGVTILKPPPLPMIVQFEVPFIVTGGTGRFASAGGDGVVVCVRTTPLSSAGFPAHVPAYTNHYECSVYGLVTNVGG
jgi:hypothetical protein